VRGFAMEWENDWDGLWRCAPGLVHGRDAHATLAKEVMGEQE